jgi:hydrogenase-1 operon protein HyaE
MGSRDVQARLHQHGLPVLDNSQIESFLAAAADRSLAVLLFAGDPVRWPESADVAVVLPELIEAFQGRLQGAVIARQAEPDLAPRFGVQVYPSLVFLRDSATLEVIAKIKDWSVYVDRIERLLDRAAKPSGGAAIVKSMTFHNR